MPQRRIDRASNWRPAGATRTHDWIYRLSAADLVEIDAAEHVFKASDRPLAEISPASFKLPSFGAALEQLANEMLEGRSCFMLLEN